MCSRNINQSATKSGLYVWCSLQVLINSKFQRVLIGNIYDIQIQIRVCVSKNTGVHIMTSFWKWRNFDARVLSWRKNPMRMETSMSSMSLRHWVRESKLLPLMKTRSVQMQSILRQPMEFSSCYDLSDKCSCGVYRSSVIPEWMVLFLLCNDHVS